MFGTLMRVFLKLPKKRKKCLKHENSVSERAEHILFRFVWKHTSQNGSKKHSVPVIASREVIGNPASEAPSSNVSVPVIALPGSFGVFVCCCRVPAEFKLSILST